MNEKLTSLAFQATGQYGLLMIDPAQIRAARALLGWNQDQLAAACGVSLASVKNIERGATDPRASTLGMIQSAFEQAGLVFLEAGDLRDGGKGVRHAKPKE